MYTTDAYVQALTQLVDEVQADVVLLGHTAIGKDVTPRVAAKFGCRTCFRLYRSRAGK